jgi:hypothetical protein
MLGCLTNHFKAASEGINRFTISRKAHEIVACDMRLDPFNRF